MVDEQLRLEGGVSSLCRRPSVIDAPAKPSLRTERTRSREKAGCASRS